MSTLNPLGLMHATSSSATKLSVQLARDLQNRKPPPVSLAGEQKSQPATSVTKPERQDLPPSKRNGHRPELVGWEKYAGAEPQPDDVYNAYTREQLWKMDAAFSARLETALRNGRETRAGMIGKR